MGLSGIRGVIFLLLNTKFWLPSGSKAPGRIPSWSINFNSGKNKSFDSRQTTRLLLFQVSKSPGRKAAKFLPS